MAISKEDIVLAKQTLSSRHLRRGLLANVVSMTAVNQVDEAVAMASRNVHAVGVGRKVVEGKLTNEMCVRIYVVQKLAETLLPPRDRLPAEIDGIVTDVVESPPAFILGKKTAKKTAKKAAKKAPGPGAPATASCTQNRQARQRPVVAGISAAHVDVTAGTIAYFCRSTRAGDSPLDVFVLSNNHVFANVNLGDIGDDLYQPGPADGGVTSDHFADLFRYVPIVLDGTTPNLVDAAIGKLRSSVDYRLEVCSIGKITGVARGVEGMAVRKHGRTTGYTEGEIDDESYDALVGMDHSNPSVVALFENQMRIVRTPPYNAIGLGGDSGSLVVAKDSAKAVGLYFAGPPSGQYGVANHFEDVISRLEIQLMT